MTKKRGLGRGLDALLPQQNNQLGKPLEVDINNILPNPEQPRKYFDEKELLSLSESIKLKGILEPLIVLEKNENDSYILIAGERRLRASKLAGLETVPVIIKDELDDNSEKLELALIENLCRENLNPIEEALSYQRLEKEFNKSQTDIAKLSGKDRSTINNTMRLLKLPEFIQDDIKYLRLSAGHGRALLALNNENDVVKARAEILSKNLNVRQTEALIKKINKSYSKPYEESSEKIYFEALSESFSKKLNGLKVKINYSKNSKKIEIYYNNNEDLEKLMQKLHIDLV